MKRYQAGMIIGAVVAALYLFFTPGEADGLDIRDFEELMYEASSGEVRVEQSEIKTLESKEGLYTSKWNGLVLTGKTDKHDQIGVPYAIMIPDGVTLDELSLGHFQTFALAAMGAADPSLGPSERESILFDELQFNDFVYTATPYQTERNGLYYSVTGTGNFMMFTISETKMDIP